MNKEIIVPGNEKLFSARQTIESEKRPSAGIAMVIIGIDPNKNGENINSPVLWTNIEKKPKLETDRLAGQISFPSDTRKIGEDKLSNMLGTLPEFSGNDGLIRSLSFTSSSYINEAIKIKENHYDLMIVFLNGFLATPIIPLDGNEVSANGWMRLEELRKLQKENPSMLRSFVEQIIGGELIGKAVDDYFRFPKERIPFSTILPRNFSIANFYKVREKLPDVIGRSQ
ncbi:MAG: hypothetical protein A3B47_01065 [Candidatus Levybacteria bacterium RIFCSPLOWO2_01_FULL_39_24]|nr:MAG: hypothetical protein A2800_03100 [Candidatus Levybacteria bacterium RIFCSPHIGHO2_01_FULL_40_16]OGH28578.1 MAG: hypothetical protein A3E12_02990 [Candidatus Levybacteria bacterium RIFCSPHIGHO2_12_FULL_39_9]OGH45968.1 MAG: hypothetical protein A3B47_01065 [Candidatus Levybacteria bacterium RIFCSPLOWO2_01_FULL_39_24]